MPEELSETNLVDKVVYLNRVAKVVKGGRRFSFSAIVVVGNQNGLVGYGLGKAKEVSEAIRKGIEKAKKNLSQIPLEKYTIPHETTGRWGASKVILKPASEGIGMVAGGAARAVIEVAGIRNILVKILGSHNPHNVVRATMEALTTLKGREEVARRYETK